MGKDVISQNQVIIDLWNTFNQALEHFAHDSNVDTSKLILCGGSAGGQLALATTSKLIDQGIPVHGVVALVPIAIGENAVPDHLKGNYVSMKENADAPLIDYHLMRYLLGMHSLVTFLF